MNTIKTLLIEDEEKSLETLKTMLSAFFEEIEIVATANTVDEAVIEIYKHKPELVFADISLPDGTGFDVLDKTKNVDFNVIFTTAYEEYSVDAFEYAALHYILKPISIDKIEEAINRHKAGERYKGQHIEEYKSVINGNTNRKIAFNTIDEVLFKPIKDIMYCMADGNYTKVYFVKGETIMISQTLKVYDKLLSQHNFFRIHSKYLVNMGFIKKYTRGKTGSVILENNIELPVSETHKKSFLAQMERS